MVALNQLKANAVAPGALDSREPRRGVLGRVVVVTSRADRLVPGAPPAFSVFPLTTATAALFVLKKVVDSLPDEPDSRLPLRDFESTVHRVQLRARLGVAISFDGARVRGDHRDVAGLEKGNRTTGKAPRPVLC
jgi:hypothetical protein